MIGEVGEEEAAGFNVDGCPGVVVGVVEVGAVGSCDDGGLVVVCGLYHFDVGVFFPDGVVGGDVVVVAGDCIVNGGRGGEFVEDGAEFLGWGWCGGLGASGEKTDGEKKG